MGIDRHWAAARRPRPRTQGAARILRQAAELAPGPGQGELILIKGAGNVKPLGPRQAGVDGHP